jgi:hypothetical protein
MEPGACNRRRIVAAVAVLLAAAGQAAAGTSATATATLDDPRPHRAAVIEVVTVRPDRDITLVWSARSRVAGGRFRLYRVSAGACLRLVGETEALLGEHTYSVDDSPEAAGAVAYRLCFASDPGVEATLGSIVCLGLGFETPTRATSPAHDLCAVLPAVSAVAQFRDEGLVMIRGCYPECSKPEPETPPHRLVSL